MKLAMFTIYLEIYLESFIMIHDHSVCYYYFTKSQDKLVLVVQIITIIVMAVIIIIVMADQILTIIDMR